MDGCSEISADGCSACFGRALYDPVQSFLVVFGCGCDECDEVGALGEADAGHPRVPCHEARLVVENLGDTGRSRVADNFVGVRWEYLVAAPTVSADGFLGLAEFVEGCGV